MQWIEDPGHAWLEISAKALKMSGVVDKISSCSYIDRAKKMVYLEEDCDAAIFLKAIGYDSWQGPSIPAEYQENTFVRDLPRFPGID